MDLLGIRPEVLVILVFDRIDLEHVLGCVADEGTPVVGSLLQNGFYAGGLDVATGNAAECLDGCRSHLFICVGDRWAEQWDEAGCNMGFYCIIDGVGACTVAWVEKYMGEGWSGIIVDSCECPYGPGRHGDGICYGCEVSKRGGGGSCRAACDFEREGRHRGALVHAVADKKAEPFISKRCCREHGFDSLNLGAGAGLDRKRFGPAKQGGGWRYKCSKRYDLGSRQSKMTKKDVTNRDGPATRFSHKPSPDFSGSFDVPGRLQKFSRAGHPGS